MPSDTRTNDEGTIVVLVAVEVSAASMDDAQRALAQQLPHLGQVEAWWFAEDNRIDGSDNDPAVFVPLGDQAAWAKRVADERDLTQVPTVTLYDGGLEVGNPWASDSSDRPAGNLMFGVVTEESEDEYEEGCYDFVLGHWPNGEEWVELQRWPVEWDVAASMREAHA